MLSNRSLIFILKHLKVKSCQKYSVNLFHCIRPDNYLNTSSFNKPPLLELPRFSINSRFQHNQQRLKSDDNQEKFLEVLMKIERNKEDLSKFSIKNIVQEMHKSLNDIAMEEEHEKYLLQSKTFNKLISAVEKSFNEMEVNDIVRFLELCNKLHVVHKIKSVLNILKKVRDNSEKLKLANKIRFCLLLHDQLKELDEGLILELRRQFMFEIEGAIKNKMYLNNDDDTIAALEVLFLLKKLTVGDRIHVLYSILDLTNWNNGMIFKLFLKVKIPLDHPVAEELKEIFLKRIKKEISANNKYLCDFLVGYSQNLNKNFIDYDKDLVDAALNQILKNNLNTQQIRKISRSLSRLEHISYQFLEYSMKFLEENPEVFSSHPAISSHIIEAVANSNCNYEVKNRWANKLSIITNASNVSYILKSNREVSEIQYLYSLTQLASLGVFVDEELEFLVKNLKKNQGYFVSWKSRMLVTNLSYAVTVLHPSFPEPILNDSQLSLVRDKLSTVHKESRRSLFRLELLQEIKRCLALASGVTNCMLLDCMNKFSFAFDGLVGINSEGNLFDFDTVLKTGSFLEDLRLPNGYDIVALHLVTEPEHSRNTWDLKAASSLRLKVTEALGFRTVIIYETLWKSLKQNEKEKYLYMFQG